VLKANRPLYCAGEPRNLLVSRNLLVLKRSISDVHARFQDVPSSSRGNLLHCRFPYEPSTFAHQCSPCWTGWSGSAPCFLSSTCLGITRDEQQGSAGEFVSTKPKRLLCRHL